MSESPSAVAKTGSSWAPFSIPVYRSLWLAQMGSNIGTWMQTVGAQWMMVQQPNAATLVSLVLAANLLPMMFVSLPAGVLADVADRRRVLLIVGTSMAATAGTLAALTVTGLTTPAVLITLTFLLGCGQALMNPAWQAIQPELVPRTMIPAASALGSLSVNIARAIGPAIAGVLVALTSPAVVFAINTISFFGVLVALVKWSRPAADFDAEAEIGAVPALRAGTRYIRNAPAIRRVLLRSALFVPPAGALWALLPVVAEERLGLGASGYGALLGAMGAGAILGAALLQQLRARLSSNHILAIGTGAFATATLATGTLTNALIVAAVLVAAGTGWLFVLSTLNSSLQLTLPGWVRARGLSIYLMIAMGGQGIGALAWGIIAGQIEVPSTLAAAAALMFLSAVSIALWPLRAGTGRRDRTVVSPWPEPILQDPAPDDGPVLVVLTYRVPEPNTAAFLIAIRKVGVSRRRTGAARWGIYRDSATPNCFVEIFSVPSWAEHMRQHSGRLTGYDHELEQAAKALADGEPTVQHLFSQRREVR